MSIAFVVRDDTSAPSTEEDALAEKTRDDIFSLIIFFLFLLVLFANNAREEEVLLPEIIAETEEHAREDILSLSSVCLNNARAKKF